MEKKEIENLLYEKLKDSDIDKTFLKALVRNTAKYMDSRIQLENKLPKDVFIDCNSLFDANVNISLFYNDMSLTNFYIGNVGMNTDEAFEKVIKYMEEHDIIDYYTFTKPDVTEVGGYFFNDTDVYVRHLN